MTSLAAALALSYLLGSIPTALIVGRVIGGVDIREHGSGNAGATNVYRLFGMKPYLLTLGVDAFKGYAAVVFAAPVGVGVLSDQRTALYCGAAAVAGHVWTVFAGFRGGKGVATAGGVFLGLAPYVALASLAVYLAVTGATKYVSLGSMMAAVCAPVFLAVQGPLLGEKAPAELIVLAAVMAALIFFTHRDNIRRLLRGEEKKTYFFSRAREK
ncbi:MAG: glycerol-3-phosphate 1-O-acyltransferase PlsY [Candidatus Nitrospinota bacterium M3_3B_026]